MLKELSDKTALVTGASRGIGSATAVALARNGAARVVLHYGGYRKGAEETLAAVRDAGAEGEIIQADLETLSGIHAFVSRLGEAGLQADILVNNAGALVKRATLLEFTDELFDRVMNLNVRSVLFISQAVAPGMIQKGSGTIVSVSSVAARNGGGPGATVYAAAKAAVTCLTKGLAKELAPQGVRVNAVAPGVVDNHFHERFSTPEFLESMRAVTPAGCLGADADIAGVILFLCSDAARYIHGQTIDVNGGYLAL